MVYAFDLDLRFLNGSGFWAILPSNGVQNMALEDHYAIAPNQECQFVATSRLSE